MPGGDCRRSSRNIRSKQKRLRTGRKVQLHERIDGLGRRVLKVDEALVREDLEVLHGVLVHVR